ncbi:MAG TPA: adenylyltransferase/cytidyltransferase family protein, partial [Armatimonadota bacterium]|nr:adenylyltransferase/cytidyltransferase family protein [Armatimonadota bacterium]
MKVIRGIHQDILPASVITLGMFDGVHRGHQALLTHCREHADQLHLPAVALTYEP